MTMSKLVSELEHLRGETVTSVVHDRALEVLRVASADNTMPDRLYSTESGGVTLAFGPNNELTVEISSDGEIYFHRADIAHGTYVEETIPAGKPASLLRGRLS